MISHSMNLNYFVTPLFARTLFFISLAVLAAVVLNSWVRTVIKVPKNLESKRSRTYISVIHNIITVLIYGILLYVVLVMLGINITPLLASAGIIGVAVGFGARSLIEDLISGVFLLSQRAIAIGDYVKIDDTDEGYIESIGLRTLTIRDESGALHIIPNGYIKRVINFSQRESTFMIDIPVKATVAIDPVLHILEEALLTLQKHKLHGEYILPVSTIKGIQDIKSDNVMVVRAHLVTAHAKRWRIAREYRYLVKKGFEKHKLNFG